MTSPNKQYYDKYMEGKKKLTLRLSEELNKEFEKKLKADNLTKQEVLETAVYQYINGELRINKIK